MIIGTQYSSRIIIWICLFLPIQFTVCLSQDQTFPSDYISERITVEDGVSSTAANCFLRDRHGFMWIGTSRGLNRYDGYSFKSFFHNENDNKSLSDDNILCMCEGNDGMIWIGTMYGGLNKYDPAADVFTHFPVDEDDPFKLSNSSIVAVCTHISGDIWFAAHMPGLQSIYKVDNQTERIECISYEADDLKLPLFIHSHAIIKDSDDNMWVGYEEGLLKYDNTNRRFVKYGLEVYNNNENSSEVLSIYEDMTGILWIGSYGGGLYQFNKNTNQFQRFNHDTGHPDSLNNPKIAAIAEDYNGTLILRNYKGIDFLNKQSGQLTSWRNPRYGDQLVYQTLKSMYWDKSGVLWFSVPKGGKVPVGIYKLSLRRKEFIHFTSEQLNIEYPDLNWISSIFQDTGGNIWVGGSPMGLAKIESSTSPPLLNPGSLEPIDRQKHSTGDISAIYQDKAGFLWIGNWRSGALNKLDFSGKPGSNIRYDPDDRLDRGIPYNPGDYFNKFEDTNFSGAGSMRIHEDKNGYLWLARGTGLDLFDPATGNFYSLDLGPQSNEYHKLPVISSITEDESACLWIGTMHQGLFKMIPPVDLISPGKASMRKTVSYRFDADTPKNLGDLMITSLCIPRIHKEIDIWIGTSGAGFFGLSCKKNADDKDVEQFVNYSRDDGLSDDVVYGIQEDKHGNLWLSTENGLSRFSPQTKVFRNYSESDGMPIHHFHWLSSHKGKDGQIFFGGDNGLLSFNPDNIFDNPNIPPVVLTGFKIFNEPVPIGENSPLKKSITETTEIELTYSENYLTFEYAALDYVNTGRNRYKYMMEGVDMDWIDAGTARTASYSNLKHGKYSFRVKGSNNDGIWNEQGTSIRITIHPPPWLSWWAYCIYSLLILGLIRWYRTYLLNRAKLQTAFEVERIEKEKVQELDQLKSRFFANISHEFRTPLTLITGPINDLMKEGYGLNEAGRKLLGKMKRNSQRLMQLINQLLELSKLETGKMKLEVSEGDLSGFLRSIFMAFLSLAEKNKIRYENDIEETPDHICFDKDKVEKIVTNLISNALKFTQEGGSVAVKLNYLSIKTDGSELRAKIMIKDTGPGIPVEEREKIFERFYQVSSTDKRIYEGSGIGLALTKELLDLYRGEIRIESEIGKGSTFLVTLPASRASFKEDEFIIPRTSSEKIPVSPKVESDHKAVIPTQKGAVPNYENDKALILVVEDNPDLRDYISQNLLLDYQILDAENGSLGLQKATESIPDLVISDLMMPEMDGIEMCEKLKSDHRTSHIPLIMLTAKADKTSKMESLETGADDYILKPFDAEELQARVSNLIEQRKRLREHFRKEFLTDPGIDGFPPPADQFLDKLITCLKKNFSNSEFNVLHLGQDVGLSQSQLYRKVLALSDQTPSEFIRNTRLKMAAKMFNEGHKNVSVVLYAVGFNTPSRFSKYFRELFGVNPSDYIRKITPGQD